MRILNPCALTGLEQPPLIGNYTHLFLEQNEERATAVFKRYQQALIQLSTDIEKRNKQRE